MISQRSPSRSRQPRRSCRIGATFGHPLTYTTSTNTANRILRVGGIPGGVALGILEQPAPFVVPAGRAVDARLDRSFSDAHVTILNLILRYRVKGVHRSRRSPSRLLKNAYAFFNS